MSDIVQWRRWFVTQGAVHVLADRSCTRLDLETGWTSYSSVMRAVLAPPSVYNGATSAQEVWRRASDVGEPLGDPIVAEGQLLYMESLRSQNLTSIIIRAGDGLVVDRVEAGVPQLVIVGGHAYLLGRPGGTWVRLLPGGQSQTVEPPTFTDDAVPDLILRLIPPRAVVSTDDAGIVTLLVAHARRWSVRRVFDLADGEALLDDPSWGLAWMQDGDGQPVSPLDLRDGATMEAVGRDGEVLGPTTVANVASGMLIPRERDPLARHAVVTREAAGVVDGRSLWPWTADGGVAHEIPAEGMLDDAEVLIELDDPR